MTEKPFDQLDPFQCMHMKISMENLRARLEWLRNLSADRIIDMPLKLFLVD